jgi:hypothetical protein
LRFEPPVPAAKWLYLELPAANFGGEGVVRFRIDAAKLTTAEKATKEAGEVLGR